VSDLLSELEPETKRHYGTNDLRAMLRAKYPMPEYCLMEEVRDAAGFKGKRSADAIAMAMWESRGLEILGFEVKASRSDWLRERKNPEKADAIANYCDRWFIVAAPGCVKLEELPEAWGLMEARGKGLAIIKAAPKRVDPHPLTRTFVAAMMRRCGELDEQIRWAAIQKETTKARDDAQASARRDVEHGTRDLQELRKKLALVKEATGIDLESYRFDDEKVIAALKFALAAHDLNDSWDGLRGLQRTMQKLNERIDGVLPMLPAAEKALG
jgi:hypothetical protein